MDDLALAVEVARTGARVAASLIDARLEVRHKAGRSSPVSDADVAAERAMVDLLVAHRPSDGLLAEEGSRAEGDRTWLVDPIDGTENYLVGDPIWCSAVALTDAAGTVVTAIHHAASGDTFWARRGAGAWCSDRRLSVVERPLAEARLATFVGSPAEELPALAGLFEQVATVRMCGSGTLELAWLAAGRLDVWVQRAVEPWDWLPGALLVEEAAGTVGECVLDGATWKVACPPSLRPFVLAALCDNGWREKFGEDVPE